jgi:hypothetical protein
VQIRDTNDQVKFLLIHYNKKPQLLNLPDLNQKFDSLKMLAANDKAYIMAIDDQKKQTLYVLYYEDY